ncbi:hypothetical protein ZHAS_00002214 [Anopheles sinensis]|uniref:Uncharacterized protein n=1 Tax=Anopheles sinensis TaxID=74873 RepID=A0A084VBX8_ANOSI|nr:hypothetical protein ZHAS_00002214 [Anopheles sinensis]
MVGSVEAAEDAVLDASCGVRARTGPGSGSDKKEIRDVVVSWMSAHPKTLNPSKRAGSCDSTARHLERLKGTIISVSLPKDGTFGISRSLVLKYKRQGVGCRGAYL